ncbi:MAG: OmpA family protein [Muribaculaceae bacterium]|nr:OmpA family protein [Muribaculaceae bacterium]
MKKTLLAVALLGGAAATTMNAQELMLQKPNFGSNWSIGLDGGVTTPLNNGPFFGNMRGAAGLHIQKQITPAFGVGAEGLWGVNTSSWGGVKSSTAFDSQYVGAYGVVNLFNLFSPYSASIGRVFDIEAQAGAGWGHDFYNKKSGVDDQNYFATKAGLNFNFHAGDRVTFSLKPSVMWNMTGTNLAPLGVSQTTAAYDSHRAAFNLLASVSVALGDGFSYVVPNYNLDEIAALNAEVNDLRGQLQDAAGAVAQMAQSNKNLQAQLSAAEKQKPEIVKTTNDFLSTVRYVNFAIGKYNVPADQMPNVAAVAVYLKNHPKATVQIKGYASQDGPLEVNERLANQRAESVKNLLINKYGISANRIQAEGQGIGHMFEEESWNRVAVCILDNNAPVSTSTSVTK